MYKRKESSILKDSIEIKSTPEKIFEFFENWENNYSKWHPDHGDSKWLHGSLNKPGSVFYAEEFLHGRLHKLKCKITDIKRPYKFDYKFLFPMSLLISRGSFIIEQKDDRCIFTATMNFRFSKLLKTIAKRRMIDFMHHMREESENLKRIIESEKK
jgi:hypothetical protein